MATLVETGSDVLAPPLTLRTSAMPRVSAALVFVGVMFAALFAADLWLVWSHGSIAPFYDDWEMVPYLTGDAPVTVEWIWSQHNEHRIPLPKLVMLALGRLTAGDFRAGSYLNVCLLGALALAMICVASQVRGRTSWADIFFPVSLLHFGHQENLVWSFQTAFVLPVALAGVVLLVMARRGNALSFRTALVAGISIVSLPLCGAPGVLLALPLALWLGASGGRLVLQGRSWKSPIGWTAVVFAGVALALVGGYFIGFGKPADLRYSANVHDIAQNLVQFSALSFGYNVDGVWDSAALAVLFLVLFLALILAWICVSNSQERMRALGLLLFLSGVAGLAVAVALGRPGHGSAPRYMTLAALGIVACYWTALIYAQQIAGARLGIAASVAAGFLCSHDVAAAVCLACAGGVALSRRFAEQWMQGLLTCLALLMLAPNLLLGLHYSQQRSAPLGRFVADVHGGRTAEDLARRYSHGPNRIYPREPALAAHIEELQKARLGPYHRGR